MTNNLAREIIVIKKHPPNIDKIDAVFPGASIRNHVFAWGNVIYNPLGGDIDEPLRIHEMTHFAQQAGYDKIEDWWDVYLGDVSKRLEWEVEAYANQYRSYCTFRKDANDRFRFLLHIANDLSDPMYGNMCTRTEAMDLIKSNVRRDRSNKKYIK